VTPIELLPVARGDLQEIWSAIAAERPAAADRVLGALASRIGALSDHPRLGPRRTDIHVSARALVEGHFLILYETEPDTDLGPVDLVRIVRIVDGRRDLRAIW
jgi:toxin ParE1/3/4